MTDTSFQIDGTNVGNRDAIEIRVAEVGTNEREALRLALGYLYLNDGPVSIPRNRKSVAETHLTSAELFVLQWLHKRTDGKLKKLYGPTVLETVKRSRYRCEKCNFPDVRALNLEKFDEDQKPGKRCFACLCANCNTIAARKKEMTALAYERKQAAERAAAVAVIDQSAEDVTRAFNNLALRVAKSAKMTDAS